MKKIKLLTPIITAGVLSAAIPTTLVSCNKNNEEDNVIWLDQWDEATRSLRSKGMSFEKGREYSVKIRWADAKPQGFKYEKSSFILYCGTSFYNYVTPSKTTAYIDDRPLVKDDDAIFATQQIFIPNKTLTLNDDSIIKIKFTIEEDPNDFESNGWIYLKKY
ncbi:MAG: hypothetical protein ACOQNV_00410 [Mycoplasmoidaceae bacterium]